MIHLVTGGSGSGKSEYAESLVVSGKRQMLEMPFMSEKENGQSMGTHSYLYIATMQPFGEEAQKRIARHHALRKGKGFDTIECYRDLEHLQIPGNEGVLLECISNLAANELFSEDGKMRDIKAAQERILRGIEHISTQTERLVIVTNEIGSDIETYSEETRQYISLVGNVNRQISRMADKVTEVVYGIAVPVK